MLGLFFPSHWRCQQIQIQLDIVYDPEAVYFLPIQEGAIVLREPQKHVGALIGLPESADTNK